MPWRREGRKARADAGRTLAGLRTPAGQLDTPTRLFVYGTLLSGEPNHRWLASGRLVARARTGPGFRLYDLGAFPGLVAEGWHQVAGEVYEVGVPTLTVLDRLEGHPKFYRRTAITLEDGTAAEAYLLLPEQVKGRPILVSGDWRSRR